MPAGTFSRRPHAWLVLARCSNLPTVWSNCLAGWYLGGGWATATEWRSLAILLTGASALYTAGMFLNDVFDVDFDARHRPERPIPSGRLSYRAALWGGVGLLAVGCGLLALLGAITAWLALALAGCIVVYDWLHKRTSAGLFLMAGCRWLLYPLAASAAGSFALGSAWLAGALLASYVLGLSWLAREESLPERRASDWLWLPLILPPILLGAMAHTHYGQARWVLVLPLAFWIGRIRYGTGGGARRGPFGRPPVAALLAGIVLLDVGAVAAGVAVLPWLGWFAVLFGLALLFQKFVPAT